MSKEYKRPWWDQDFLCGFVVDGHHQQDLREFLRWPFYSGLLQSHLPSSWQTPGQGFIVKTLHCVSESSQGEILQLRLQALKTREKQTPECPRWNSLRLCELHPLYNASFRWLAWLIWLVVVLSRLSIFRRRCTLSMRIWGKNYWKVVAWWLITQWRGKCGVPVVNLMQNESLGGAFYHLFAFPLCPLR